jgi:CRP-like cAMP-binding protein
MLDKYKAFIEKFVSFNSIEWQVIKTKLNIIHIKKGDIIHHQGDICDRSLFINSGLARGYIIDENGKDYTWHIFFNDENAQMFNLFAIDNNSFTNQTPSNLEIEALEDCEFVEIKYKDVEFLYNYFKKGERFGRLLNQKAYGDLQDMFFHSQTKTAQQRFDEFINKTPYLLDKVPQYHIASYLGISPQHLSRLKKEYQK